MGSTSRVLGELAPTNLGTKPKSKEGPHVQRTACPEEGEGVGVGAKSLNSREADGGRGQLRMRGDDVVGVHLSSLGSIFLTAHRT